MASKRCWPSRIFRFSGVRVIWLPSVVRAPGVAAKVMLGNAQPGVSVRKDSMAPRWRGVMGRLVSVEKAELFRSSWGEKFDEVLGVQGQDPALSASLAELDCFGGNVVRHGG